MLFVLRLWVCCSFIEGIMDLCNYLVWTVEWHVIGVFDFLQINTSGSKATLWSQRMWRTVFPSSWDTLPMTYTSVGRPSTSSRSAARRFILHISHIYICRRGDFIQLNVFAWIMFLIYSVQVPVVWINQGHKMLILKFTLPHLIRLQTLSVLYWFWGAQIGTCIQQIHSTII